jgi:hypothetical protein
MNSARSMNSLLPLGATGANVLNTLKTNVASLNQKVNTAVPGGMMTALGIFVALVLLFIFVMSYYNQQILQGYNFLMVAVRDMLGLPQEGPIPSDLPPPSSEVTAPHTPPQQETDAEKETNKPLVEKILPQMGGAQEVFNVSKNTFTYYDAEPLCRALGAELATYDQVKEAWERGADWCNYGWVKGQTAVYPTQKNTFDLLQAGPEEQRTSCGVPGLNGGFFDNPELRFGVNCYGKRPSQSNHDATAAGKGIPVSPEALEIQKKIAHFRTESASLSVMPFNNEKWSTS